MNANNSPSQQPDPSFSSRKALKLVVVAVIVAAVVSFAGIAFLVNIMERKQEGKNPFYRVVELTDTTEDPAVWGKNFPHQYDDYLRTTDQVRTKFGGSEAMPRTPSQADPRSVVAQSKLEEDPRLKTMWAGYAFSID
ncbi:MAG: ammonia-forming cytochrome c nitrite reductase subunit c552, partial [Verrucomicrobiia bacterium]